jgi:CheY-like chemotaxis protein
MSKILWIEDEANKIGGLVRPLIKDGNKVIIANDKVEALSILSMETDIDLIILDIIIPEGGDDHKTDIKEYVGCILLQTIRTELHITIPIIVLTVVDDEEILTAIRKCGVSRVLRKGAYLPSNLRKEVYDLLSIDYDD